MYITGTLDNQSFESTLSWLKSRHVFAEVRAVEEWRKNRAQGAVALLWSLPLQVPRCREQNNHTTQCPPHQISSVHWPSNWPPWKWKNQISLRLPREEFGWGLKYIKKNSTWKIIITIKKNKQSECTIHPWWHLFKEEQHKRKTTNFGLVCGVLHIHF